MPSPMCQVIPVQSWKEPLFMRRDLEPTILPHEGYCLLAIMCRREISILVLSLAAAFNLRLEV
jgi:hypothetical protein